VQSELTHSAEHVSTVHGQIGSDPNLNAFDNVWPSKKNLIFVIVFYSKN
jgi:hypothetical protein